MNALYFQTHYKAIWPLVDTIRQEARMFFSTYRIYVKETVPFFFLQQYPIPNKSRREIGLWIVILCLPDQFTTHHLPQKKVEKKNFYSTSLCTPSH
jgi:hypothetical protein